MRRGFAGLILLGAVLGLAPPPAEAGVALNTIGATATRLGGGHVTRGTVLVACTAGQQVEVTLTLVQGGVRGTGHGAGVCTGELTAYAVTVPATGGAFTAGPATACATAVNRDRGVVVDAAQWCRPGGVSLSAAVHTASPTRRSVG